MTQAQKTAKAKFKQAIAYRQKTGVTLKEAFAHIYGKKTATKKKAAKKVVRKKAAKKRIGKIDNKLKKTLAKKGKKMPHGYDVVKRTPRKKISGVKKKRITEKVILNRIHTVKRNVEKLDEAQHKHMISGTKKYLIHNKNLINDYETIINRIHKLKHIIEDEKFTVKNGKKLNLPQWQINMAKHFIIQNTKLIKELTTHARELKKHI